VAAEAYVGDTTRLKVTFRDYTGQIDDPDTVLFEILATPISATPTVLLSAVPTRESSGVYYYDWTPTAVGDFVARFTGTFTDASVDIVDLEVTVSLSSTSSADDEQTLGVDSEVNFASGLDPLYVDPEMLSSAFPDQTLLEIAEQVYVVSLEIYDLLSLEDDEGVSDLVADYIMAQAACNLSRLYGSVTIGAESLTLGDFRVDYGSTYGKSSVNRGNALTWCEVAASLRKEVMFKNAESATFMKGSNYYNPIPVRKIRSEEDHDINEPHWQGTLDD